MAHKCRIGPSYEAKDVNLCPKSVLGYMTLIRREDRATTDLPWCVGFEGLKIAVVKQGWGWSCI